MNAAWKPTRRVGATTRLLVAAGMLCLAACSTAQGPDPWRKVNEHVFGFNEGVDKGLLEPVAKGWHFVIPEPIERGIGNFFVNLTMPRTLACDLLQAKPDKAAEDLGRLMVNTIFGLGGLIDVASKRSDIPKNDEDFGQTFGRWGTPAGPYVVLPLAGPDTVRDTLTAPLDIASNPTTWLNVFGLSVVRVVNTRARYLAEIDQSRKDAVDYYVFVRAAYLQNRERAVSDGASGTGQQEEDLYNLEGVDDQGSESQDANP